ncbi:hypothetical protein BV20DRAFT_774837 [Pilatotrama ljubarskyi]|nr:hypothetical protein BV20DRAFT_774837 [Pilatotrama ljubarskyi]
MATLRSELACMGVGAYALRYQHAPSSRHHAGFWLSQLPPAPPPPTGPSLASRPASRILEVAALATTQPLRSPSVGGPVPVGQPQRRLEWECLKFGMSAGRRMSDVTGQQMERWTCRGADAPVSRAFMGTSACVDVSKADSDIRAVCSVRADNRSPCTLVRICGSPDNTQIIALGTYSSARPL